MIKRTCDLCGFDMPIDNTVTLKRLNKDTERLYTIDCKVTEHTTEGSARRIDVCKDCVDFMWDEGQVEYGC